MPDPFSLEEAVRAEIGREMKIAKAKYGADHFEVLCIEGGWGHSLDDRQTLEMLRYLNRSGSIYREVICRAD
jgi:hypothetical protein